ncbi:hypothetical protein WJX72_003130 [[Myrmecia] bisecta]|uniref:Protein kinase domain-containing protein n=1 Tax=[Myrmecia] bisecta TaxID=41462 RepID=A0AAW1QPY5_9CHLO
MLLERAGWYLFVTNSSGRRAGPKYKLLGPQHPSDNLYWLQAAVELSDAVFRLWGGGVLPFTMYKQSIFGDQLRNLLSGYNFMSIALSDYQEYPANECVDVTARLVSATPAQEVVDIYRQFAYDTLQANTTGSTFRQLLSDGGLPASIKVVSMQGVPNSPLVTQNLMKLGINFTLAGATLLPLTPSKQASLLSPLEQFLGDHASNVSLQDVGEMPDLNQVDGAVVAVIDEAELPQLMLYLFNASGFTASTKLWAGPGILNITSVSALPLTPEDTALSPTAAVPPASTAAAAVVTQSSDSPTASVAVPQASSGNSVSMNIVMRVYGSALLPFTPQLQFQTASAMAGVFSIIIGTGQVAILSATQVSTGVSGATMAVPATGGASHTPNRHLLQSPGSSVPAQDIVFGVTLPQASKSSLLVLQSNSTEVRKQFASWFVSQMAARDLAVTADVQSVAVAPESAAQQAAVSAPAQAPAQSAAGSAGHSSSNNVGAIVGGVVGGVVALALIAAGFIFLLIRDRNRNKALLKLAQVHLEAGLADHAPQGFKDVETGMDESKFKSSNDYSTSHFFKDSALGTNGEEGGEDDTGKRVVLATPHHSSSSRHALETSASDFSTNGINGSLVTGGLLYDKYTIGPQPRFRGCHSVVVFAADASAHLPVVIKFYPDSAQYLHEKLFYENRMALEEETATEYLPALVDTFAASDPAWTSDQERLPPCIILQRGDFKLLDWLKSRDAMEGAPNLHDRVELLYNLCKAVEFIHARQVVHRQLCPANFMWFAKQANWKLIDFGLWARMGEAAPLRYNLRYAAPELLVSDLAGETLVHADPAADMWSLGLVAYEVLTGCAVFGDHYNDEAVISMLLGYSKLPWEDNVSFFNDHLQPEARAFVADLLRRSPDSRKPVRTAVHSPLFASSVPDDEDTRNISLSALLTATEFGEELEPEEPAMNSIDAASMKSGMK